MIKSTIRTLTMISASIARNGGSKTNQVNAVKETLEQDILAIHYPAINTTLNPHAWDHSPRAIATAIVG